MWIACIRNDDDAYDSNDGRIPSLRGLGRGNLRRRRSPCHRLQALGYKL